MSQASKPKKRKWPGELGRPIDPIPPVIARLLRPDLNPAEIEGWIRDEIERERYVKLRAALRHYGIPDEKPRSFIELAKRLATELMDGFKLAADVPKPVGKPGRWTGAAGIQLIAEVTAIMGRDKCGAAEAVDILSEADPVRYPPGKRKTILNHFYRIRKHGVESRGVGG